MSLFHDLRSLQDFMMNFNTIPLNSIFKKCVATSSQEIKEIAICHSIIEKAKIFLQLYFWYYTISGLYMKNISQQVILGKIFNITTIIVCIIFNVYLKYLNNTITHDIY